MYWSEVTWIAKGESGMQQRSFFPTSEMLLLTTHIEGTIFLVIHCMDYDFDSF